MNVAIIGAGAAGLMCAASILETDPSVEIFLFERNDGLGKKVIISGGGRCNVTTGIVDIKTVLTKYPRGNKFLNSAIRQFPPQAVQDWFESHGVPLKCEEDLRVFPQSDDGHDVVRAFERVFADAPRTGGNVRVLLKTHVVSVGKRPEGGFSIFVRGADQPFAADKLVLTTGGQAYRATGSTGDGYAFAQSLGHSLTRLAPSLNSFGARERWPADVSGVSFERARITAHRPDADGREPSFTGPFLFTHKGVSGPAVFALSSLVAFEQYGAELPLRISIDLFPDVGHEELRDKLMHTFAAESKKDALNAVALAIPRSLAAVMGDALPAIKDKRGGDISKADAQAIADWMKGIPLTVVARGAGDEFVTAGGVPLTEVNPSTMESLITPNLFFAGEILDIDGFTGGFNLQASWATGRLAGNNAAAGTS